MIIECDGKDEQIQSFEPLDYESASREQLIDFMMNAGIVGLGGAGFPAYIKYKFAKDVEKLIINAVECEPFITADYKLVFEYCDDLIRGTLAMKKMAMAKEAIIAIKVTHKDMIDHVNKAIQGIDGIKVVAVPDVYPMGWERVLVREIMHKEYDRLPGEVGAIVNNETTAIAFGRALKYGEAIGLKTVTISGTAVKKPQNVQVPVGMCVKEIVEACGGYTCEDVKIIAGGPMMGTAMYTLDVPIQKTSSAILAFAEDDVEDFEPSPCIRCGRCVSACPSHLVPQKMVIASEMGDNEAFEALGGMECYECGSCTFVCPAGRRLTQAFKQSRRAVLDARRKNK